MEDRHRAKISSPYGSISVLQASHVPSFPPTKHYRSHNQTGPGRTVWPQILPQDGTPHTSP